MVGSIDEIRAYIERTGIPREYAERYELRLCAIREITRASNGDMAAAIMIAFDYGRAKGWRARGKSVSEASP